MYSLSDMMLLADEVMRQKIALSYFVMMNEEKVFSGSVLPIAEVYRDENLSCQFLANIRAGSSGFSVDRIFVYMYDEPEILKEAVQRARLQDEIMWNVSRDVVCMRYVVDLKIPYISTIAKALGVRKESFYL